MNNFFWKPRPCEIQARKVGIEEGLDRGFLDSISRSNILQRLFLKLLIDPMCLICCKSFSAGGLSRLNEEKCLYVLYKAR